MMSESRASKEVRIGAEAVFDALWSPVCESHSKFSEFIRTNNIPWRFSQGDIVKPQVVLSDEVGVGLHGKSDEELFETFVDKELTMANIAKYIRFRSLSNEIERNVSFVNVYLGFDPNDELYSHQGFTGREPKLYLHGIPGSHIHGHDPKRSVRLFGFNPQGTHAIVKRFGDREPRLDTIAYSSFCYGSVPIFKPTVEPGDYDVIPEAQSIGGGNFH